MKMAYMIKYKIEMVLAHVFTSIYISNLLMKFPQLFMKDKEQHNLIQSGRSNLMLLVPHPSYTTPTF